MKPNINSTLKQYWGFDKFRPLQEKIITTVLAGTDTLVIMPTGGGKSLCYQLPAMMKNGICLVISPLIALMKDQVEGLRKKGIASLLIHSGMGFTEVSKTLRNAAYGNYKFLYVSPERLESRLFQEHLPSIPINILAVDEAHCISQWGYDFRPPYLRISAVREHLDKVPVIALTASATKDVQEDICLKLLFHQGYQTFQHSFERPNLSYSAFKPPSKEIKLLEILNNVKGSGIVYCKSRRRAKQISDLLRTNNISADFYHAGLSNDERSHKQESWLNNHIRVISSTNAFGMGIDKSNVRTVVHFDVPDSLESYYQEAGRAGRDEKRAYAVLLFGEPELKDILAQPRIRYPSVTMVKSVYQAIGNYLQLPTGMGEGLYYDFDIADFSEKFKLKLFDVVYAMKILEQENVLIFSESVYLPSTVVFTAGRADLEIFEKIYPDLDPLIKGLLRSYQGIVDSYNPVNEKQLATFIKDDVINVKRGLMKLNLLNIIEYTPQKNKSQVQFIKNRCRTQDLSINLKNLTIRKKAFQKRISAILDYVQTSECRSKIIGNYFNDEKMKACGICDNCIKTGTAGVGNDEFEMILTTLKTLIAGGPAPIKDLLGHFKPTLYDEVWNVIDFLGGENRIIYDRDGNVIKISSK